MTQSSVPIPRQGGMQPISSDDLPEAAYHRLLVLGGPKDGKTYTTVMTCEGPTYVINSDDKYALQNCKDAGFKFDTNFIPGNDPQKIWDCITMLRREVKAGRYKSVIWDTLSKYSWRALQTYEDATRNVRGESDGRQFWNNHANHIFSVVDALTSLDCHVIVNSHYDREGGQLIKGQAEKSGEGIVPSLPTKLRLNLGRDFQNIVFLRVNHREEREFLWNIKGVFGPGGRTLPKNVNSAPADINALWGAIQSSRTVSKPPEVTK